MIKGNGLDVGTIDIELQAEIGDNLNAYVLILFEIQRMSHWDVVWIKM